ELLLLSSMEVEASWAAVLRANGYVSRTQRTRLNTEDYVLLLNAMRLDSYTLSLTSYPSFPAFTPFENWSSAAPTQTLDWYNAYNMTKHNREDIRLVISLIPRSLCTPNNFREDLFTLFREVESVQRFAAGLDWPIDVFMWNAPEKRERSN